MQQDFFMEPETLGHNPSRGDASLSQFFTPFWAAQMLAQEALEGLGDVGVVEPSCGTGAFLSAIPARLPAYGVDIDPKVAAIARANTGRSVLVGDFRTVELPKQSVGLVIGNPPFEMPIIDSFLIRSHSILPEDGVAAFILPAHVVSTADRVNGWAERFSIDVKCIPRSLFSRISMPLVWAKFIKSQRRTMVGLLLFAEQGDIQKMPKEVRRRLAGPGTWRDVVRLALESLGGHASLAEIYRAVEPRRPSTNQWWKDKVRQTLGLYFQRVDEKHWTMPQALAA